MPYTFTTEVTAEETEEFLFSLPHYNVMQSPAWAQVKPDWSSVLCGVRDGHGKLCGSALVLIRKLPLGFKIAYSPRGFVADYSDAELVSVFTAGLRAYCKKIGAYVLRIDPEIRIGSIYKGEKTENAEGLGQLEALKKEGFLHMGFATDFNTYTQPRFNAEYSLRSADGTALTDEEILGGFDKKLKKFIGSYTEKRGIFFVADLSENAVEEFVRISEHTEQRQHILLRDAEYFTRMKKELGDDLVIMFAKMDLDRFEKFLDSQPDDEQTRADRAEAKRLRAEKGKIVDMSAVLFLKSRDTAYLMYSGFDDSVFPRFRTTNQIRFEAMRRFRDEGLSTFSFMGIHGDLNDTLSEFKLKFNPVVVEFAGEFEMPVRPLTYKFMAKAFPKAKKLYIGLMLRLKGKK